MNILIERHQELLSHLLHHGVAFIIIGGYSVIYHGYKRTTGDVDIWLKPDTENRDKLILVLKKLDLDQDSIQEIAVLDFSKHLLISIWEEPEKVDFLTYINSVNYPEADQQKEVAEIDGLKIPFLNLDHLILSKINTGRIKDKADVEELQKTHRLKKD